MRKADILSYFKQEDFHPSKKMGQNFLLNDEINQKLVNSANITNHECVLEVGPGLGALTKYLMLKTDCLLAVELDKRLFAYLKQTLDQSIHLINDDILHLDLDQQFQDLNFNHVKMVANLPYNISSKVILKALSTSAIDDIYILVQKEMAQRICAKQNSKQYNAFTVLVQMFSDVKSLYIVSPKEFLPIPNVDSTFLHIQKNNKFDISIKSIDMFLKLCFLAKRKKTINNLQTKYKKEHLIQIFSNLNLSLNIRSEQLSIEQFYQLFVQLNQEL